MQYSLPEKKVGIKLDLWSTFTKPLAACLALVAVILSARLLAGGLLETSVGTLAVIGFGAVVYGVAVVALKVLRGCCRLLQKTETRRKEICRHLYRLTVKIPRSGRKNVGEKRRFVALRLVDNRFLRWSKSRVGGMFEGLRGVLF